MNTVLLGLLPIFVLALIAWAVSRGIKLYASKYPAATTGDAGGVGSWLLLLILGLMFLGPIVGAARINDEILTAEVQYPNLKTVAAWGSFKFATWLTYIVVCCLSLYAGIGLVKGRDPSVVKRAKILLWVIGPFASIVMGFVLPAVIFGRSQSDPNALGALIGALVVSIIGAAIWTAYLSKSMRVKATYGDNSSTSDT